MSDYMLYHNPQCSKSRAVLALLKARDIAPTIVEYLNGSLDATAVDALLAKVGGDFRAAVRMNEAAFAAAGLTAESSREAMVRAIVEQPILLQRPILVHGARAVIGRPPENVLTLLDDDKS